ncbi:MAG: xanthine dehydrogenase family protein subunit M [Rhodomicrobium sp.]
MKPAPFKYLRAETPQHAVALLKEYEGAARLLAGGQSLIPMMNLRLSRPEVLVDIGRLPLNGIAVNSGSINIGTLACHRQVMTSKEVAAACAIIPQAMRHIGHPTIRNQGTAGGSLANADPTAEICALAMLLDAKIDVLSVNGSRTIAAKGFFAGAFTTALVSDEMITAIHLYPPPVRHGSSFLEVSERKGDFAIAAAGATAVIKNGVVEEVRIVVSGARSTPLRAQAAERLLIGKPADSKLIEKAADAALEGEECYSDIRASAGYRRDVLRCLVSRVLAEACKKAGG